LNDIQAAVLGCIQGATEWLPISSTAHLRVVPALLGWSDPGAAFTAVSQLGTLLSALVYFRKDIAAILTNKRLDNEDGEPANANGRELLLPILIGTLPIIVAGLALKHAIEGQLRSLWVVAGALIVFALILALAESRKSNTRGIGTITTKDGLLVGLGQMLALIPGASRSGTTITAALFIGLDRATAARFSFLLSLPAVFLAGAKELYDALKGNVAGDAAAQAAAQPRPLLIATVLAFVVGLASIHWLMKFLRTHPTTVFIVYRIVLGLGIIGLLASGKLSP
jgi:undecaprenyl-diphosphatase